MESKKKRDEKGEQNIEIPVNNETAAEENNPVNIEKDEAFISLQNEINKTKDSYLRIAAEYENYRRRSVKERENLYQDATAAAAVTILPVLDNLERAMNQPTSDAAFLKGIEMTLNQFRECLAKLGVKEIPAQGEQFDPLLHNAVMHVEMENCDDNTIIEVFEKGYIMGDRVIRHAIVKVAN